MIFMYSNLNELKNILKQYEFFKDKEFELIPLKKGEICRTFCMKVDDNRKYLVRINDEYSNYSADREVTVNRYLKEKCSFDWIPNLYYYSTDRAVAVTEFFDNYMNLSDIDVKEVDVESISNEIFTITNQIHSIKDYALPSYYVYMSNELKQLTNKSIIKNVLSKKEADIILNYFDSINYFKTLEPVLIHSDIQPDNLIYNIEKKELHIIDFEFSMIGDKYYDYAHIEKTFKKIEKEEYLSKFYSNKEFNSFIKSDIYDFYDLYFELSWYNIDLDYNRKNEQRYNYIKDKLKSISNYRDC